MSTITLNSPAPPHSLNLSVAPLSAAADSNKKRKRDARLVNQLQKQRNIFLSQGPSAIHSFSNNSVFIFPAASALANNPIQRTKQQPSAPSSSQNQHLKQLSNHNSVQKLSDTQFIFPAPAEVAASPELSLHPAESKTAVSEPLSILFTLPGPKRYNPNTDANPIPFYTLPLDIHSKLIASAMCTPKAQALDDGTLLIPGSVALREIDETLRSLLAQWITEMTMSEKTFFSNSKEFEGLLDREKIEMNEQRIYAMHELAMENMNKELINIQHNTENLLQMQTALTLNPNPINNTANNEIRINSIGAASQIKQSMQTVHECVDEIAFLNELRPTRRARVA
jgi:hypothetical protein